MNIFARVGRKLFGSYSRAEKKRFVFAYALVAIPLLQLIVFWLYVNFDSIALAFRDAEGAFTFKNFRDVWYGFTVEDRYGFNIGEMLGRTVFLWFVANGPVFVISLATTYVLFRKVTGHYVFRIIFLIPSLVGSVVWCALFKYIVAYDGPVLELLKSLGTELPTLVLRNGLLGASETGFPTIVWMTIMMGIVGGSAILTSAYARIPHDLFEYGQLEGVGFWKEFFTVVLPCVWPTIATLITFSVCGIFTADGNVFLLTNGTGEPDMSTMGYYLYYMTYRISQSSTSINDYNYPAAVGLCITVITVPIALIVRRILDKATEPVAF